MSTGTEQTTTLAEATNDISAPSAEGLIERLRDLQPMLRANSAQGEADRRVSEESFQALRAAGAFKVLTPKRYGGYELSMRKMLDVTSTVGEADGGTAWVVTLLTSCAWMVGGMGQQAQDDVWAENPDAVICGSVAPQKVTAVPVEGGSRISGRWPYASGSWHVDWALVGVPSFDEAGVPVDMRLALIPRSELELEETWFVAGMRSSGSNTLVAEDVFVPEYRFLSMGATGEGLHVLDHPEEVLYSTALGAPFALFMAGAQLGLGRAALEIVQRKAPQKGIAHTIYSRQADSVAFQLQLAQASMLIETAVLHAYAVADEIDGKAAAGERLDYLSRARIRAQVPWAIEHIVKGIDVLLYAHGAGSFAEVNPLQRIWRDSEVAARHAGVLPMVGYEMYGKAMLGIEARIAGLV